MTPLSLHIFAVIASLSIHVGARSVPDVGRGNSSYPNAWANPPETCQAIQRAISNASAVYAFGSVEYEDDIGMLLAYLALCVSTHPSNSTRALRYLINSICRVFSRAKKRTRRFYYRAYISGAAIPRSLYPKI